MKMFLFGNFISNKYLLFFWKLYIKENKIFERDLEFFMFKQNDIIYTPQIDVFNTFFVFLSILEDLVDCR